MITGYNTDVKHRDVVFHVQTEDKGVETASVESLIYIGGRVLARRMVTYKALLERGEGRDAVSRLMDKQHRMMISQIKGGRFDEQVFDEVPAAGEAVPAQEPAEGTKVRLPVGGQLKDVAVALGADGDGGPPVLQEEALREETAQVDAGAPLPGEVEEAAAPATAPPAAPQAAEPAALGEEEPATLDQVIFDYLASAANQEHLVLMMDESPALAGGQASSLELRTYTSRSGRPIAEASVTVRMISTQAPPRTLGEGVTDGTGELALFVEVPDAPEGTAALIITASSELGDAEIRHLL